MRVAAWQAMGKCRRERWRDPPVEVEALPVQLQP